MAKWRIDCIYCGPGRASSEEHIVPRAIGGSFSRSDIICDECNAYFGGNVDYHIADWQLSLIARNWFDLEGYGGSVPSYEVKAEDGTLLTAERKGILRPKWRDIITRHDGKGFYFSGGAPTEAEARKTLANVIAKQTALAGQPPTIIENRVEVRVRREWKPFESDVVYDYSKQGRAIAKMALHYLATQLDRRFLLTRDFAPVMRFVRYGEHALHPRLCQPAIPQEWDRATTACVQHSLVLRCNRELRSAVCDVTLFGALRYSVVLSYSYEGPDLVRRLTEYPLEKRWEEGPAQGLSPVPARLILNIDEEERRSRYDRLEEAVHTLVDWLNHYGFCHHIRETLPRVIEHVSLSDRPADQGVESWLAAIADELSDRSAPAAVLHFSGEPSQVAAEVLFAELQRAGATAGLSSDAVEERFARLLFIRLLVDALALLVQSRGATKGGRKGSGLVL
jgi:hypothetical protein